jgi:hypothetical protein
MGDGPLLPLVLAEELLRLGQQMVYGLLGAGQHPMHLIHLSLDLKRVISHNRDEAIKFVKTYH